MEKNYHIVQQFPYKEEKEILRIVFPLGEVPKVGMKLLLNDKERSIVGILFERTTDMIQQKQFDCLFEL